MKKVFGLLLALLLILGLTAIAEDGQDPVMNLIGPYLDETSQRAAMNIQCGEAYSEAEVEVSWANSAFETVVWRFSGIYDEDSRTIPYSNCKKVILTTSEDGQTVSEETVYENGTGMLMVDPDTYELRWQDDMEDAGEGCVFDFNAPPIPTILDGVGMFDSEASVIAVLGEPAWTEDTEYGHVLGYEDISIAGLHMRTRLFFTDDMLRAEDFANRDCGDEGRSDLSMFMDGFADSIAGIPEEKVKEYAEKYTEIGDLTYLGWTSYYMKDGTLMMSLRTERDGVDLLCVSNAVQG